MPRLDRRRFGFAQKHRTYLVLRNVRDRILRRDCKLVSALVPRPVIRNKYCIRTNRSDHANLEGDRATPRFGRSPFALFESKFSGEHWVNFYEWVGTLINQGTNSPGLCPREKVTDHTPRREHQWIVRVGVLGWRTILRNIETRPAIRKVKGPLSLRDRVP